jgi:hypothetical protein
MKLLRLTLLLVGTAWPAASAQDDPYAMPDDLQPFWGKYYQAKLADDEAEMDRSVRTYREQAEMSLDVLLDDVSLRDRPELPGELRALAWSLDRVSGQTRYIERVRFVLDLPVKDRRVRREAMLEMNQAFEVINTARFERSEEGWERAEAAFGPVLRRFEELGDHENVVLCLRQLAETRRARGHRWDEARYLERLLAAAQQLAYKEVIAEEARGQLDQLLAQGIDPRGERPPDDAVPPADGAGGQGGADGGTGSGPGRGLTSYKAGSEEQDFELEPVAAKKGVSNMTLPSFAPPEQYLVWDQAYLGGSGPEEFRGIWAAEFMPFGAPIQIARDGLTFTLDTDNDGEPDVEFTPTSTPQLVELPSGDGTRTYPLMICVPSDRESMFGLDVNFSLQPEVARLRFNVGGWMEGEVLGETWRFLDTNLTGRWGDQVEHWGDGLTRHSEELKHIWFDVDALQIGRGKATVPFSPVLPVGDAFYRAETTPEGTRLTLRELDLETGAIQLDIDTAVRPTHVLVREVGTLEGAIFNVVPAKKGGTVAVPAGTYVFAGGRIEQGKKTSMKQARMYQGRSEPFEVGPGQTHVLALGAPYTLEAETRTEDEQTILVGRSLRVFGRGGEEYAMLYDDALQPEVEAHTQSGKKVLKGERMRQADISAWQADASSMWFPMDMPIEMPKGETLVLRLMQKSHVLLGGPFESPGTP